MKNILPLVLSSAAMLLVACSGGNNESKVESQPEESISQPAEDGARKVLEASIERPAIELDEKTKVITNVEGVTFRSSDEDIASVTEKGAIYGNDVGMAYITVSKEGYFDKVLKVFVDEYGTIDYLVEGFEFGPAIVGVKLNLEGLVKASDLKNAEFNVKTNGTNRTVTGVNLCDPEGEIINATESHYIRVDCEVTSSTYSASGGAQCFSYTNVNDWSKNITAEISLKAGSTLVAGDATYNDSNPLKVNRIRSRIVTSTREWGEAKTHTSDGYTLSYKGFEPDRLRADGVLNPLVIWLHGQGEGGTDPDIAILGNDVTELGNDKIQSHFVEGKQKGAYVLAAQTPTMWMDNGKGQNHGGVGHSIYTKTLKSLIDKFIKDNGDIDTNRIFVGGCSNGGYMTMEMAVTYGNFFRGFYPCCEAYSNSFVTDEDIAKLKDLPMWFVHASNDRTVNPNNFTLGTYTRLMDAGAKDIHLSYFVDVRGTQGNPRGNNYDGHWSWIYIFRDEVQYDQEDYTSIAAPSDKEVKVDGKAVNLFDWMQSKK